MSGTSSSSRALQESLGCRTLVALATFYMCLSLSLVCSMRREPWPGPCDKSFHAWKLPFPPNPRLLVPLSGGLALSTHTTSFETCISSKNFKVPITLLLPNISLIHALKLHFTPTVSCSGLLMVASSTTKDPKAMGMFTQYATNPSSIPPPQGL